MRIFVTGGAGYIGSHTVDLLIEKGYEVTVLDNLSTGHRQAVHTDAEFIEGTLLDRVCVADVFENHAFDGIMHFASHTLVGESMEQPWLYLRDNILSASYLLEEAVKHGVNRFILSSTANLFDEPEQMPITADNHIVPGSPYGESKAIIERYLHWMHRIYGMKYCTLRYFNAAGAHTNGHIGEAHEPEPHLIPLVLQVALGQREKALVFGDDYDTPDGSCVRDYVHVMDLADAHILALQALDENGSRKYNLGNSRGYSVKEVIEVSRSITGHPIPMEIGARRAGDPAELVADSTTIKNELGWQPAFNSLEKIIESAWKWHQAHPHGYA